MNKVTAKYCVVLQGIGVSASQRVWMCTSCDSGVSCIYIG
jgi:hypothetical protein